MGGFKQVSYLANGVEKFYNVPVNDADGTNGLLDTDANIQELSHMVGGFATKYWWAHASGTGNIIGTTEIFNTNVANSNGGIGYFTMATSPVGTNSIASSSFWIKTTQVVQGNLYGIQDGAQPSHTTYMASDGTIHTSFSRSGSEYHDVRTTSSINDGTWHHITTTMDLQTLATTFTIDGVSDTPVVSATTLVPPLAVNFNRAEWILRTEYNGGAPFPHYFNAEIHSLGRSSSDLSLVASELYNGGVPKCFDLLEPSTQALFNAYSDLANWVGHIGQELEDKTLNGFDLVNTGVLFTGSAQIECEAQAPPVGIQWTQDSSLLDPPTDVVYGIDPAVTTWIDKGTSSTNLTQTTVAQQPNAVISGTPSDNYMNISSAQYLNDLSVFTGNFTHYFEMDTTSLAYCAFITNDAGGPARFDHDTGNSRFRLQADDGTVNNFDSNIVIDGIHKYIVIKDGTQGKIYRDGALVSNITLTGTFVGMDRLGNSALSFNAPLFDYRNINRALTDAEAIAETT